MWQQVRLGKGSEYREFVDQIVAETAVTRPTDELADWRAAVAAERGNVAR